MSGVSSISADKAAAVREMWALSAHSDVNFFSLISVVSWASSALADVSSSPPMSAMQLWHSVSELSDVSSSL